MDRRDFTTLATGSAAALVLGHTDALAQAQPENKDILERRNLAISKIHSIAGKMTGMSVFIDDEGGQVCIADIYECSFAWEFPHRALILYKTRGMEGLRRQHDARVVRIENGTKSKSGCELDRTTILREFHNKPFKKEISLDVFLQEAEFWPLAVQLICTDQLEPGFQVTEKALQGGGVLRDFVSKSSLSIELPEPVGIYGVTKFSMGSGSGSVLEGKGLMGRFRVTEFNSFGVQDLSLGTYFSSECPERTRRHKIKFVATTTQPYLETKITDLRINQSLSDSDFSIEI